MSKWYMCVATGEDGMARSYWHESEREATREATEFAGTTEEMGDCMTIEFTGDEPPRLGITYATDPEMVEGILCERQNEGDDVCDICGRSNVICNQTTADGRTVCVDCADDWQDEWDEEDEDE